MEHITFWDLLKSPAHWQFEAFLIILLDVIIGILIWPRIKKWFKGTEEDHDKLTDLEKRIKSLEENKK